MGCIFLIFFNEQIWWSGGLGKDGCKWILPENRNSSHILLFMFSSTDYIPQYITLYSIRILRTLRTHTKLNSVMRLCSLLGYE